MKMHFRLLTVVGILVMFFGSGCKKEDTGNREVQIAGLFSLTGNWSSLGVNSKAAIELAAADINTYFKNNGKNITIKPVVYDTKLEADLCLQHLKDAYNKGIRFVIGPQSSAELGNVVSYANDNKMLVVSQGSTAGSLAIAGDNVLRFCPSDAIEGAAIAKSIYNSGVKALVTMARDDAGNKGLQLAVSSTFTALGGTISTITPYAATLTDFTALVTQAKTSVDALVTTHGVNGVGVYLASFDECVGLFKKATAQGNLAAVKWYGGDGVALSNALIADAAAADFAIGTKFFAPAFGLPDAAKTKWEPLSTRISAETKIAPDAFALAVYDAVWVYGLSIAGLADYEKSDFNLIKNNFILQANSYYGATGPTLLNSAGDRSISSFDYWGIAKEAGVYKWKLMGRSE